MCIIVFKPAGKDLPDIDTMLSCFDNNPDGAGFMYRHNGRVHIQKGFMTYKGFFNALDKLGKAIDIKRTDLVFHFRFATQGSIVPANCHPFPISSKVRDLKAINIVTSIGVAHNGVISFCADKSKTKLSDTQLFIKNYLSSIPAETLFTPAMQELIKQATNSKFAIMGAKQTALIGDFIEDKGIHYSNTSYKTIKIRGFYSTTKYSTKKSSKSRCDICGQLTECDIYDGCLICNECLELLCSDPI